MIFKFIKVFYGTKPFIYLFRFYQLLIKLSI